jgi:hypothetical protein
LAKQRNGFVKEPEAQSRAWLSVANWRVDFSNDFWPRAVGEEVMAFSQQGVRRKRTHRGEWHPALLASIETVNHRRLCTKKELWEASPTPMF